MFCESEIIDHLKEVHSPQKQTIPRVRITNKNPTSENAKIINKNSVLIKESKADKIILISKRGTRIVQMMNCNSCGSLERVLWHYAKSNKGAVTLCGRCKIGAFERSFEKVDAMKMTYQRGSLKKKEVANNQIFRLNN
jgi:transcription elongation factor Elf1